MKNVDFIAQTLEKAGVKWVFGVPSGPVLPLINALEKTSIAYVLTANETSAGFMATAIGSLTGIPGVCLSTLGPGATNLATGVGCAWLDGAPVIAITCNVPTPWLERRIQMRIDHHALYAPITKASLGLRADNVAASLAQALATACAEPPGPVHLDLPEDVGNAEPVISTSTTPAGMKETKGVTEAVAVVTSALAKSRRPLLMTGLGFTRSAATDALLAFAERQHIPFISTMHAKGWLPETHPNWAGVLGRARRTNVQRFINEADLVIAVGYDPIEINYEEWVGDTPIIHIATEMADVDSSAHMLFNAASDMDAVVRSIAELPAATNDWSTEAWAIHRAELDRALRPETAGLSAHRVLDALRERLPADGVLAYDVGAHTHQIATQWRTDFPRTCISTNGWSSMGYGIPGAIAAKLVHPDKAVVGVVGDGCFQMTVGELNVARRLNLHLPIIVLNDGWLGLIKLKQQGKGFGLDGAFLGNPPTSPPDYFGVPCRAVTDEASLQDALEWGMGLDGPSVIEVFIDPESYTSTVYD
jgi:acetolactate synthase-1/2/3 large subunit